MPDRRVEGNDVDPKQSRFALVRCLMRFILSDGTTRCQLVFNSVEVL